jgi:hypothetical protein
MSAMGTPAAAQRDLAAAALLRAFLADDRDAGLLVIDQHTGSAEQSSALIVGTTKLAARVLLSANGYDVAKALAVIDGWMATTPPP